MILDEYGEFCDATALNTGGAASYLVGDVIDLGTTATSGGSATGQFHLASDAQAAIAVDGTATYHYSGPAIAVATLVAGYEIASIRLPSGSYERYLGILQTTAVAAFTAGKINAFLTKTPNKYRSYPDATN
jgi:hypothetical protein